MPSHGPHEEPGNDPRQILKDGCAECEYRAAHPMQALGHMDPSTFRRAMARAITWQTCDDNGPGHYLTTIGHVSHAEAPVLETIWVVMLKLRDALPLDVFAPIKSEWGGSL
jgi:hypothetical protein